MPANSDLWLKVAGSVATGLAGIYQWQTSRLRARLKDDLDILARYRAIGGSPELTRRLEVNIEQLLAKTYRVPRRSRKGFPWDHVFVAALCLGGAAGWLALSAGRVSLVWQIVVAASLAFVGIGGILNAVEDMRNRNRM